MGFFCLGHRILIRLRRRRTAVLSRNKIVCMESSVYVLFSVLYVKHYTEYTTDLDGPMLSHNEWERADLKISSLEIDLPGKICSAIRIRCTKKIAKVRSWKVLYSVFKALKKAPENGAFIFFRVQFYTVRPGYCRSASSRQSIAAWMSSVFNT